MKRLLASLLVLALAAPLAHAAVAKPTAKPIGKPVKDKPEDKSKASAGTFAGLKFRNVGPALTSGRVIDLAVHPRDKSVWYVAAAYGGVWKTTNAGTTFTPIFDGQGTSSIGSVTLDPQNPSTVWVGSGENNSQRSVGWGDGVYRSDDAGKTWTNMGLKASEHIGMVRVHPSNSDVVFVAAQGPLWSPGGDRGLYKSVDGGKNWKQVLKVDEWTGASEVWFSPRDPQVMFASTYQRHRRVWTLIDGGPGSGIYKSIDGGETWKKLTNGLPNEDMGRIGLAISPAAPEVIYAIIEAAGNAKGVYRSDDNGVSWSKQNGYMNSSPQYYTELFADPKQAGRVYSVDTFLMVTEDAGKTWKRAGEKHKHVDNHVVWFDPDDTRHMLVGCDGGLYETFDRCENWVYMSHLPITQFYKVEADNALPFYNVYGGTQDNNTIGGPSQTGNTHGIRNSDWFITLGGDGFQPRVDPTDPNVVYSQYQNGGLARHDRGTGSVVDIQPQPEPGEAGSRWNWDSPLIISPHSHTRLYYASQRLWQSDDRGDTWKPVSPDLTRQLDRNRMKIMGRVWSVEAVAKNTSTSFYGNIVAIDESPRKSGLLYVGTDDGLIQVSDNNGASWRRIDSVPGVGEYAYVSRVVASQHGDNTVYAAFDRHKMGDLKPYVFKSTDQGRTWTNITGDIPTNCAVYAFVEDHKDPDLLFVGTEFGVYMTQDGGKRWVLLKGGMAMQCVRDLAIQKREDDLIVCSFSRGFYILDDMSPLRLMKETQLQKDAALLPIKKALMYVPRSPMGGDGPAEQGERMYTAPNPPTGAVFTYYLKDEWKSREDARKEREKEIQKAGGDTFYPSWDSLRAESREEAAVVILTVKDEQGRIVRRIKGDSGAGFHRASWDFRYPAPDPATLTPRVRGEFEDAGGGPLAAPGTYTVSLERRVDGVTIPLASPQTFVCAPLGGESIPITDRAATVAFQQKVTRLQRAMLGASRLAGEATARVQHLKVALNDTPSDVAALEQQARAIEARLYDLNVVLNGDRVVREHNEPTPATLTERLNQVVGGAWTTFADPTTTHERQYTIAASEYQKMAATLKAIIADLAALEAKAEAAGAPWTPGRLPEWKSE